MRADQGILAASCCKNSAGPVFACAYRDGPRHAGSCLGKSISCWLIRRARSPSFVLDGSRSSRSWRQPLGGCTELPTVDEAGLPGLYLSPWHGMWAPRANSESDCGEAQCGGGGWPIRPCGAATALRRWNKYSGARAGGRPRRFSPFTRPRSRSGGLSSRVQTSKLNKFSSALMYNSIVPAISCRPRTGWQ